METLLESPRPCNCETPDQTARLRQIAEEVLNQTIDWRSASVGYCDCPGANLHTSRTGPRDYRVAVFDSIVAGKCFHATCAETCRAANREMIERARACDSVTPRRRTRSEIQRERAEREVWLERQRRIARAKAFFPTVLKDYGCDPEWFLSNSPHSIPADPREHWRLHLSLFAPEDIVWVANIYGSCTTDAPQWRQRLCALKFKPVSEWLDHGEAPGNITCPSIFKPGTFSRSNEQVVTRRFLVVESDTLSKVETAAVLRWIATVYRLRALVDTGGKSLHGWFDTPPEDDLQELRDVLPAMHCDPALFKSSQPCRLAGAFRREKDRFQRLLWLDPNGGVA